VLQAPAFGGMGLVIIMMSPWQHQDDEYLFGISAQD